MKIFYKLIVLLLFPVLLTGQSVSPEVISSSGNTFEGSQASISWTLGELATETYTEGTITITQGFQQSFGVTIHGIDMKLLVFLEGPTMGDSMSTFLTSSDLIPLQQPYNTAPWNYDGGEIADSIPQYIVDWVLIELRDADSAVNATSGSTQEKKAALLRKDGSIVDLDGSSILHFSATLSASPFIVVWHRNHVGILSSQTPLLVDGVYTYDFSVSANQVHGSVDGYKQIDIDLYGMAAGDANSDGIVNLNDKVFMNLHSGSSGYKTTDLNLDTQVNNTDKNESWYPNNDSITQQVPD